MTLKPLKLYTCATPNGLKLDIVVKMLGLEHERQNIDMSKNEQKEDWFIKLNPNGRIPILVDPNNNDYVVMETGAILMYLCDKYDREGKLFPKEGNGRYDVIQWLMFQMAGIGPMMGQYNYFLAYAPEMSLYSTKRYRDESERLLTVIDLQLSRTGKKFLCSDNFTIADAATIPWVAFYKTMNLDLSKLQRFEKYVKTCMEIKEVGEVIGTMMERIGQMMDSPMGQKRKARQQMLDGYVLEQQLLQKLKLEQGQGKK